MGSQPRDALTVERADRCVQRSGTAGEDGPGSQRAHRCDQGNREEVAADGTGERTGVHVNHRTWPSVAVRGDAERASQRLERPAIGDHL